MKRPLFLSGGWILAGLLLYLPILLLELYWNLADWHPRWDQGAAALFVWITVDLLGIWRLAGVVPDRISRTVSFLVCVCLLAVGSYVVLAEPLSMGLFARTSASPWWYRSGRWLLFALPATFWGIFRWRETMIRRPGAPS